MREAQAEVQVLALHGGTVADAHQLELALEAILHARHHVGDERARQRGPMRVLDELGG